MGNGRINTAPILDALMDECGGFNAVARRLTETTRIQVSGALVWKVAKTGRRSRKLDLALSVYRAVEAYRNENEALRDRVNELERALDDIAGSRMTACTGTED